MYTHAKQLTNLGISVIPLEYQSKRPNFNKLINTGFYEVETGARGVKKVAKWEVFQTMIAPDDILKKWFATNHTGLALVGGEVSGGLIYLDFDDAELYRQWALSHKPYICHTAVSKTARGYHAFFRSNTLKTGNFYYRGRLMGQVKGEGGYVVCAPSLHPEGVEYRWLRHPKDGIKEIDDITEMGLTRTIGKPSKKRQKWNCNFGREAVQAEKLLKRLAAWRVDNYDAWLRVGIALKSLGSEGLDLWHNWSASSSKYDPDVLDKKWETFAPDGDMTFGSLVYWANQDSPRREKREWKTL